jgi:hypothetical protein
MDSEGTASAVGSLALQNGQRGYILNDVASFDFIRDRLRHLPAVGRLLYIPQPAVQAILQE